MTAENHSPPARSLRRTQCTNLWVVYNCALIRDIREAHKKDSESAPQTTVANELKENLEAVENFKGSRDEKLVVLYCKQLGINYKNLSDEEFRWSFGFPKNQRKWEHLSARGKNSKEKPLLHGLLASMSQRFLLGLFS